MSKNPKPAAQPPGIDANGNFVSGITPFPSDGRFPVVPKQNYWQGGNFMVPGMGNLMSNDILERFPQLASLFGGSSPQISPDFQSPGLYGMPPTGGTNIQKKPQTSSGRTNDPFSRLRGILGIPS